MDKPEVTMVKLDLSKLNQNDGALLTVFNKRAQKQGMDLQRIDRITKEARESNVLSTLSRYCYISN